MIFLLNYVCFLENSKERKKIKKIGFTPFGFIVKNIKKKSNIIKIS